MVERGAGNIINVSSIETLRGIPGNAVYSAFKTAIVGFTRSFALEVAFDLTRWTANGKDEGCGPDVNAESRLDAVISAYNLPFRMDAPISIRVVDRSL